MKKKYIIDGYNLIFKDPLAGKLMRGGNYDQAIEMTIRKIEANLYPTADQIIIVLDGDKNPDQHVRTGAKTRIMYSNKPRIADDVIRDHIRKTKSPQQWIVVSSDNEIRNTAMAMGAKTVKSEDLVRNNPKQSKRNPGQKTHGKYNPGSIDVDYWLKQFNSGKD